MHFFILRSFKKGAKSRHLGLLRLPQESESLCPFSLRSIVSAQDANRYHWSSLRSRHLTLGLKHGRDIGDEPFHSLDDHFQRTDVLRGPLDV